MPCERRLKLPGRRDEGDCLRSPSSIGAGDSRYRSGGSPPILSASFGSSLRRRFRLARLGGEAEEERGKGCSIHPGPCRNQYRQRGMMNIGRDRGQKKRKSCVSEHQSLSIALCSGRLFANLHACPHLNFFFFFSFLCLNHHIWNGFGNRLSSKMADRGRNDFIKLPK